MVYLSIYHLIRLFFVKKRGILMTKIYNFTDSKILSPLFRFVVLISRLMHAPMEAFDVTVLYVYIGSGCIIFIVLFYNRNFCFSQIFNVAVYSSSGNFKMLCPIECGNFLNTTLIYHISIISNTKLFLSVQLPHTHLSVL
jgi:hypothetical protein